jgi:hypothetical protein
MFDNVGQLISELLSSFGSLPPELLGPKNCFEAINDSLAARGLMQQQSSEGRSLSVLPISLSARDTPLSAVVQTFLWLEIKVANAPYETYQPVIWVPQPVLEESRVRGDMRCSTYKDAQTGFWHLTLSYDPVNVPHRVWHAGDSVLATTTGDAIPLMTKFAPMIKFDAQLNLIPGILMRNAQLPEDQQMSAALIAGLNATASHAQNELTKKNGWNDMFEYDSRAGKEVKGRMRRPILARGMAVPRRTY